MSEQGSAVKEDAVRDVSPAYSVEAETTSIENVPPSYKRTEVGVIPEDWNVRCLEDFASIRNQKLMPASVDPETLCVELDHLSQGDGRLLTYSEARHSASSKYRFEVGDVLFGRLRPYLRKYWLANREGICSTEIWPLMADPTQVDSGFLLSVVQSNHLIQAASASYGTHMPRADWGVIKGLKVGLPSVEEQAAIATALSDADALIESLDRLIAKKRAIKQAAMQQLLTGQTRLPGFTGEWETKRLGNVAEIDPENLGSNTPADYTFNYISLEQVEEGALLGWSTEKFRTAPSRARRILRGDDILVSTVRPNLKSHLKFDGQFPNAVCSTGFSVVRCDQDSADPGYVYAHLFGNFINRQIDRIIAGSNYPAISSRDVKRLELPLPSLEEQTAIATVLSDMNAEIEALEHRRDKACQIKQGMMQQLLTGRVRLVQPELLMEASA